MDHAYLAVKIALPHKQYRSVPRVKDWIIGSEQFLKLGREQIITTLLDHDQLHTVLPAQEIQNMIEIGKEATDKDLSGGYSWLAQKTE